MPPFNKISGFSKVSRRDGSANILPCSPLLLVVGGARSCPRTKQSIGSFPCFRREAQLLASLDHPNIAAIHRFEECEGVYYLVMELVPGETLAARLTSGPSISKRHSASAFRLPKRRNRRIRKGSLTGHQMRQRQDHAPTSASLRALRAAASRSARVRPADG